ncbi:MAG: hypothetical protein BAJALOKI3v1_50127 [Promethearchaeota archaeon]|nr:MAG: hypothetical protein BAJALOKI3v1_50127 [Candidatus Lokiarchaeota archaeon]
MAKKDGELRIGINIANPKGLRQSVERSLKQLSVTINTSKIQRDLKKVKLRPQIDVKDIEKVLSRRKIKIDSANFKFGANSQRSAREFIQKAQAYFNRRKPISVRVAFTSGTRAGAVGPAASSLQEPIKEANRVQKDAARATRQSTQSVRRFASAHREASESVDNFASRIGFSTTRLAAYLIPATTIFQVSRAFNIAAESVKNINTEITRLTQVLGGNAETARNIARQTFEIAQNFGASGEELFAITTRLAQSGEKFSEQSDLLDAVSALAQSDLAATFDDIESTTTGVIAVLNQFNLTGSDTIRVLDIANELSKNFAFEAGNLFTAVQRGGAAFRAAGGSLEEFAALVAAIRQVTRLDTTTIATSINTLSLRLLRPDVVEFTDRLTGGRTRDAEGQLKGIASRLREIAEVSNNLNPEQFGRLVENISGVRQGKVFVPIIQNFQQFERALDISLTKGPGSIQRDAVIGLQRIDKQLQIIATRFQDVFRQLAEDPAIARLVQDFGALTSVVSGTLSALQPLLPTLLKFAGIKLFTGTVRNLPSFAAGLQLYRPGAFRGTSVPGTGGSVSESVPRSQQALVSSVRSNTQAVNTNTAAVQENNRQNIIRATRQGATGVATSTESLAQRAILFNPRGLTASIATQGRSQGLTLDQSIREFRQRRRNQGIFRAELELQRASGALAQARTQRGIALAAQPNIRANIAARSAALQRRPSGGRVFPENFLINSVSLARSQRQLRRLPRFLRRNSESIQRLTRAQDAAAQSLRRERSVRDRAILRAQNIARIRRERTGIGGRIGRFTGGLSRGVQRISPEIGLFLSSLVFDQLATVFSRQPRAEFNQRSIRAEDLERIISARRRQSGSVGSFSGAATGAIFGGTIGSAIAPGPGTLAGAGIGAAIGAVSAGILNSGQELERSLNELVTIAGSLDIDRFDDFGQIFKTIFEETGGNLEELTRTQINTLTGISRRQAVQITTAIPGVNDIQLRSAIRSKLIEAVVNAGVPLEEVFGQIAGLTERAFVESQQARNKIIDANRAIAENLLTFNRNFRGFLFSFEQQTEQLNLRNEAQRFVLNIQSEFISSLSGNVGTIDLPDKILDIIVGSISSVRSTNIREIQGTIGRFSGGIGNDRIIAEFIAIQNELTNILSSVQNRISGGQITQESAEQLSLSISRALRDQFNRSSLSDEASNLIQTVSENIQQSFKQNPDLLSKDVGSVVRSLVDGLNTENIIRSRVSASFENLNNQIKEINISYERQKALLESSNAARSAFIELERSRISRQQGFGAGVRQIEGGRSRILGLIGQPDLIGSAFDLLQARSRLANTRAGTSPESQRDRVIALSNLRESQDAFNIALQQSGDLVNELNQRFNNLSQELQKEISQRQRLSTTPTSDIRRAEVIIQSEFNRFRQLFVQGPLRGVTSAGQLPQLDPGVLNNLIDRFRTINPSILQEIQRGGELFGNIPIGQGVTAQSFADIATALRGAGLNIFGGQAGLATSGLSDAVNRTGNQIDRLLSEQAKIQGILTNNLGRLSDSLDNFGQNDLPSFERLIGPINILSDSLISNTNSINNLTRNINNISGNSTNTNVDVNVNVEDNGQNNQTVNRQVVLGTIEALKSQLNPADATDRALQRILDGAYRDAKNTKPLTLQEQVVRQGGF